MSGNDSNRKIKALVVDDSAFMGMQIASILSEDPEIEVVGRARSGMEALRMVEEVSPDVITLDVEMPDMDGIAVLKHMMVKHPVPAVVISSFVQEATETCFDALLYGAVDVIGKPSLKETASLEAQRGDIVSRVKRAARIRARRCRKRKNSGTDSYSVRRFLGPADSSTRYVCLAASAAGYYSMLRVVPSLDEGFEHVIIGMIPAMPRHVDQFTRYLASKSFISVENLRTAEYLRKGTCYVCSSRDSLMLKEDGDGRLRAEFVGTGVDFTAEMAINSVMGDLAAIVGDRAIGVAITDDGIDNLAGIEAIRNAGGIGVVRSITDRFDGGTIVAIMNGAPLNGEESGRSGSGVAKEEPVRDREGTEVKEVPESGSDDRAEANGSFYGYVAGIDIIEYLQFLLLTGKPTVVDLQSPCGVVGQIYVRNGRVVHAFYNDYQGEQALYRCLTLRGGSFSNRPWREPARVTMNMPGELVLMEAVRRRDEAQFDGTRLGNGLTQGIGDMVLGTSHGIRPD